MAPPLPLCAPLGLSRFVVLLLAAWPGGAAGWHPSAALYTYRVFHAFQAYYGSYVRQSQSRSQNLTAAQAMMLPPRKPVVLEVGSQNVNGGMRKYIPPRWHFVGVDHVAGQGVDVVLKDPYKLPFPDGRFDLVASVSALEHCDFPHLIFQEMVRVARGIIYINVPSDQADHSYQVSPDSWRFLVDSAGSLLRWAHRQGRTSLRLVQSFVAPGPHGYSPHRDTVMLFSVSNRDVKIEEALPEEYKQLEAIMFSVNACWARMNSTEISATRSMCGFPGFPKDQDCHRVPMPTYCCSLLWPRQADVVPPAVLLEAATYCRSFRAFKSWELCCTI